MIQKETIQPQVIHTTIPIHEIHENEPKHHAASALPAVSLADFKKQGGTLTGREERYDGFEGEPKAIGGALGGSHHHHQHLGTTGPHSSNVENKLDPLVDSDRDGSRNLGAASGEYGTRHSGTIGPHSSNVENKLDPRVDSDRDGSRKLGATPGAYGTRHSGTIGPHSSNVENKLDPRIDSDRDGSRNLGGASGGYGNDYTGTGSHVGTGAHTGASIGNHPITESGYGSGTAGSGYGSGTATKKPGLLDRLNPLKDADGDGKRGVGE